MFNENKYQIDYDYFIGQKSVNNNSRDSLNVESQSLAGIKEEGKEATDISDRHRAVRPPSAPQATASSWTGSSGTAPGQSA